MWTPAIVLLLLVIHAGEQVLGATLANRGRAAAADGAPILLIVSYDSFNNKYFDFDVTPNLRKVQEEGVSVPYLRNVFTTKTFPNHFSIATGLYPGRHGVTNNVVFDHRLQKELKYGPEYYHQDEAIAPIWVRIFI